MKRKYNWLPTLKAAINKKSKKDFGWGSNDCALFASDILHSITGVDPARWFRGKYSTEQGAYKALRRSPFSDGEQEFNSLFQSVVSSLAEKNGMDVINPNYLHRGDLCLVKNNDGLYTMGIFGGENVLTVSRNGGYTKQSKPNEYCWRTPY